MTWVFTAIALSTVATAGIGAHSARKQSKKARDAAQEQKYIEGSAPMLPASGDVEIDEIANLLQGTDISALIDAMEYGEGGEQIYQLLQENPEMLEHLQEGLSPENLPEVMEAVPGIMGQGIMTAAHGGAVGSPKDVYYFSVPNIQQMMGDPDAQVQNVGNAMMGQLQGNPDQGMVGATPGQIQQMARGGRVRR